MFKNLRETIRKLNADVNDITNREKAKKLRKTLLSAGIPMAIGGFLGVFICFVLFVTAGSRAMMPSGFFTRILVPFLLCIPCGGIGKLGLTITSLGLQIIVTRYTTDSIDETVEYICPNCQETINSEMQFCHRCGTELKKECPKCNHINNHISEYCQKCGTKLD